MIYYKIIKNENIIDANFCFLKWDSVHSEILICDFNQAQFVQSSDQSVLYSDNWMLSCQNKNIQYEKATIVIIDQTEYREIKQLLNENEEIPIPSEQPVPQEEPQEEPAPESETVMTVSQMRAKILQQQQQINMLTDCLLEMSEIIYA